MSRKISVYKNLDWITVFFYFLLLGIGLISIYSADYSINETNSPLFSRFHSQLIWLSLAFVMGVVVLAINEKYFNFFAYFLYGASILLLLVTIVLASNTKGSYSWIEFGTFRIQPAEFSKFITALALAKFMSSYEFDISKMKNLVTAIALFMLPAIIIVLQKETGSALVFFVFFFVLYREGMSGLILLLGVSFVALFISVLRFNYPIGDGLGSWGMLISLFVLLLIDVVILFLQEQRNKTLLAFLIISFLAFACAFAINVWTPWTVNYEYIAFGCVLLFSMFALVRFVFTRNKNLLYATAFLVLMSGFCFSVNYIFAEVMEPHQQMRIKVFLGMEDDPTGTGYNVNQSKIAIGSGEFLGKGFLRGTQTKLDYVPEQVTDFIFCNIGEEFGFVGSIFTLLIYMFFLFRIIHLAERQFSTFNRIYAYCVVCIFFFHFLINVGMVIGLMPVIGIPLPFISYGGSSLWASSIMLFILIKIDAVRKEQLH
ncbi:MAG: rod shape-determining protein RodA [Paludibacteraceae bacterium]|nr:rod shape-determining protein RodA [Paludibacteraceae bacterium]MBO7724581.1 rod shape-determining protein RodA [Paludibacteraceae bacterium]